MQMYIYMCRYICGEDINWMKGSDGEAYEKTGG